MKLGNIEEAILELNQGGVVGLPTETVYGLAAKIDSEEALKKIFQFKKRPFFDPLIVHAANIEMAKTLTANWSLAADCLAKKFWPGPLTLILPKSKVVNYMITSGLDSVGIRVPKHPMALELINKVGSPLAAPSANRFGKTSPTTAEHVLREFPDVPGIVLDGGNCDVGIESTVLLLLLQDGCFRLSILRPGAISVTQMSKVLNDCHLTFEFTTKIERHLSPGQMKHHYMPPTPLVVVKKIAMNESEILNFAKDQMNNIPEMIDGIEIIRPSQFQNALELKLASDSILAARNFYSDLRLYSQKGADILYVRINEDHFSEDWQGLMDRL